MPGSEVNITLWH